MAYKSGKKMSYGKGKANSPHPAGDSVGQAYKVTESYTDVGMTERIPSPTTAKDGYPQSSAGGKMGKKY